MIAMSKATPQIELVASTLSGYAERGVFRGFSRDAIRRGVATFKIVWHHNRVFLLTFDVAKGELRFRDVLENVPASSPMYRELKEFVRSRHAADLPEHRRIESDKAQAQAFNRRGNVSLALAVKDGDLEYGTRKFVHLVHEMFVTFLADGNYFDYLVEAFDLDPDHL